MKNTKKIYVGIFLCVFFIYFGTIFQAALGKKMASILKLDNTNKASVLVNSNNYFTLSDIYLLKNKLQKEELFAMSEIQRRVNFKNKDIDTKIIGVTPNLNQFYNTPIVEGSFFNENIEKENKFCTVLEDKLAYKLFGNTNVKGLKINVLNHDFTIIGVVKRDSSIIQKISDDGLGAIYIPLETLISIDKEAKISYLQIKNLEEGTSGKNKDKVSNLLSQIGKNSKEYMIMDYNIEKKIMDQKPLILSFILGIFCICVYSKYLIKTTLKLFQYFIEETKKEYLFNIIKAPKILLKFASIIILMFLSIFLIWKCINFNLYIPPKYIPDELINLSFYKQLSNELVKESITNRTYLNPFIDLKLIKTNRVIDLLFILTFVSILILNNLIKKSLQIKDVAQIVSYCTKCTIGALVIISFICIETKMPLPSGLILPLSIKESFQGDFKTLFTIWVFIFTKIITERSVSN